jgi:hypothetical protein
VLKDHRTYAIARNESDANAKKEQESLIHVRRLGLPQTDGWQDAEESHPATPRTLPACQKQCPLTCHSPRTFKRAEIRPENRGI